MKKLNLNENFISRIWENPAYYSMLNTIKGETVEIISYGKKNTGSGADYSGAKIKIGGILFTGDVEIHRSEKDWHLHKHQNDGKYNKVILQVVLWNTGNNSGSAESKFAREIPTVILSEFLQKSIHLIWKEIINNPSPGFRLPCYKKNSQVSVEEKKIYLDKLGVKRLKQKASRMEQAFFQSEENFRKRQNWDKALYTFLAEALGYSKNKEQFLKLAGKVNPEKVKSLNPKLIQMDSLLFNTAGFLNDLYPADDYISELLSYRDILGSKIDSPLMDRSDWNFFPLRPPNFPTLRIAYLSGVCIEILYNDFFKRLILCFENSKDPQKDLTKIFQTVPTSDYWQTHYNFGKTKKSVYDVIGASRITDIINNTLLPLFLLYARRFEKKELITKISDYFLSSKDISGNEITKAMSGQLDYKLKTISENQGAIQLHNFYCTSGKCDDCYIGTRVFTEPRVSDYLQIILY
jgi:hypothetical protein